MKPNQFQRGPGRRQRITATVITLLAALLLLHPRLASPALAQDVTNTGAAHVNATTTVHFGSNFTNNSSDIVTNDGNIEVTGAFDFTDGTIDELNNGIVIFLDGATATNAADASHVDGPCAQDRR